MTTRHRHAYTKFSELSRSKRADHVIALKNRMRANVALYGGRFDSPLALNEPGRPAVYDQHFHFAFPSIDDRFTLWNANIFTAVGVFWNKVETLAYERVQAAMDAAGIVQDRGAFVPAMWSNTGKVTGYTWERPNPGYDIFEGRTAREERQRVEAEIVRNDPPTVYESFSMDRRYEIGIGLEIVVDVQPRIDREIIETAIQAFQDLGEKEWRSPTAVPRQHLPQIAQWEAFAALKAEREVMTP